MNNQIIIIINRWDAAIYKYDEMIDHDKHTVIYLSNKKADLLINYEISPEVYILPDLELTKLLAAAQVVLNKYGRIDKLIAFSEVDQENAAFLRTKFNVSGIQYCDVGLYRNKIEMKKSVSNHGHLVPQNLDLKDITDASLIINNLKFPIVVKPKSGVSSEGVYKANNKTELDDILKKINFSECQCEEFIAGTIYHADGIIFKNEIIFCKASKYIGNCLDYANGNPLGSVIIDNEIFQNKIISYSEKILSALKLNDNAFHLEFIISNQNEIYFLELGARVGGAKVSELISKIYNINLFHMWVDVYLENDVYQHLRRSKNIEVGGWLLIPEPKIIPSKVISKKSLHQEISSIIFEYLPDVGHEFFGNGEYRDVSGAYLFSDTSSIHIEEAMQNTIQNFNLKTVPIGV